MAINKELKKSASKKVLEKSFAQPQNTVMYNCS